MRGVGKIGDIFAGEGLTSDTHTAGNKDGLLRTLEEMKQSFDGFIFVNLVDFDSVYGHRNDVKGYLGALEETDELLASVVHAMLPGDMLIVTADHGCDPAFPGTDHTREDVPLLMCIKGEAGGRDLGECRGFMTVGDTVLDYLGLEQMHDCSVLKKD